LRDVDDDEIAPGKRLRPATPHADHGDQSPYVRQGAVTHRQATSATRAAPPQAGDVQVMSAGTGIRTRIQSSKPSRPGCSRSGSSRDARGRRAGLGHNASPEPGTASGRLSCLASGRARTRRSLPIRARCARCLGATSPPAGKSHLRSDRQGGHALSGCPGLRTI